MAYDTFAQNNHTNFALEDAVHTMVHRAFAPLRRVVKYRQISRELHDMSHRELAEMGIARHQIRTIAIDGSRDA